LFTGEIESESDTSVQPIGEHLCIVFDLFLSKVDPKLVLTLKIVTFGLDSTAFL